MDKDVTDKTEYYEIDGEYLSLKKCVCGKEFAYWANALSIYRRNTFKCENCGRKLYFGTQVRIFEVIDAMG